MSQGLKAMSAIIAAGAGNQLLNVNVDFLYDEERAVHDFMVGYYRQYREVPTAGIVREHTGIALPRADGALLFHIQELTRRHQYEIVRVSYEELREALREQRTEDAIAVMEGALRACRGTQPRRSLIDIGQGAGLVADRLERTQGMGGMPGIETPWQYLNDATGGYQKDDLITFVGRTGMGKTMLILWQADRAHVSGASILFVTTEMGSEQIARRWLSMRYGYSSDQMKRGTVSTNAIRNIRRHSGEIEGRDRFHLLSLGTGARMARIEQAIDEICPDIVFVDGVYLMKPNDKMPRTRTEMVSAVFDELKQATIDYNLPFVVNTQFNRQAGRGGRDGSLETIGLSDTISQHSSIVIAVKPGPTVNPYHSRELEILKGREGEAGSFFVNYTFRPTDLSQFTEDQVASLVGDVNSMNSGADEWN